MGMQQIRATKRARHPTPAIGGRETVSVAPVVPGTTESVAVVVVRGGSHDDDDDVFCAAPLGCCVV
jgi:hypothetical protein